MQTEHKEILEVEITRDEIMEIFAEKIRKMNKLDDSWMLEDISLTNTGAGLYFTKRISMVEDDLELE